MVARALAVVLALLLPVIGAAAELTPLETRWLMAAKPAIEEAKSVGLPVRVMVDPGPVVDRPPLAMGVDGERCVLVLSMRGNPIAESALEGSPLDLRPVLIELMAVHEMAHCWRHARGLWGSSVARAERGPWGSAKSMADGPTLGLSAVQAEEGFADLAAIAWIRGHRPTRAGEAEAWLWRVRGTVSISGGSHATGPWIALAGAQFGRVASADPFEEAASVWVADPTGSRLASTVAE